MGIAELIVMIALLGLLVWIIQTLIPMPDQFKKVIYVLAVVAVVLYVLSAFGLLHGFRDIRIGKP